MLLTFTAENESNVISNSSVKSNPMTSAISLRSDSSEKSSAWLSSTVTSRSRGSLGTYLKDNGPSAEDSRGRPSTEANFVL